MRKVLVSLALEEETTEGYWYEKEQRNQKDTTSHDSEGFRAKINRRTLAWECILSSLTYILPLLRLFVSTPAISAFKNMSFKPGMSLHASKYAHIEIATLTAIGNSITASPYFSHWNLINCERLHSLYLQIK
jgi:hypothetical protein